MPIYRKVVFSSPLCLSCNFKGQSLLKVNCCTYVALSSVVSPIFTSCSTEVCHHTSPSSIVSDYNTVWYKLALQFSLALEVSAKSSLPLHISEDWQHNHIAPLLASLNSCSSVVGLSSNYAVCFSFSMVNLYIHFWDDMRHGPSDYNHLSVWHGANLEKTMTSFQTIQEKSPHAMWCDFECSTKPWPKWDPGCSWKHAMPCNETHSGPNFSV